MDIYLTGHLVLAFGIFAKNLPINQIKSINLYIFIIRPFFFVLGLKQKPPQKKISEIFLP